MILSSPHSLARAILRAPRSLFLIPFLLAVTLTIGHISLDQPPFDFMGVVHSPHISFPTLVPTTAPVLLSFDSSTGLPPSPLSILCVWSPHTPDQCPAPLLLSSWELPRLSFTPVQGFVASSHATDHLLKPPPGRSHAGIPLPLVTSAYDRPLSP